MRLTDSHGYDWIREKDGSWRLAEPHELPFEDDPEGYMHGYYHGLMTGLTIGLLAIIVIAWIQTYLR